MSTQAKSESHAPTVQEGETWFCHSCKQRVPANLNLYDAAPELLAALQDLLEHLEGRTPIGKLPDQARAAIAKAEGRS